MLAINAYTNARATLYKYLYIISMCSMQAYRQGLYGKKYVWLIIGWYPDKWYTKHDSSIDCTPEQLEKALEGHLTTEVVQYNLDLRKRTQTGIVSV